MWFDDSSNLIEGASEGMKDTESRCERGEGARRRFLSARRKMYHRREHAVKEAFQRKKLWRESTTSRHHS
jgi:hypothetical protein